MEKPELYPIKGNTSHDGALTLTPERQARTGLGLPEDGYWSSMQATKSAIAHPKILYKDRLLTFDLYRFGGVYMVNIYCPKCLNSLRIEQTRKKVEWDADQGLFIEPFRCTWELSSTEGREGDRIIAGIGLCNWSVAIEPTQRIVDTAEGRIRIHGYAKDV